MFFLEQIFFLEQLIFLEKRVVRKISNQSKNFAVTLAQKRLCLIACHMSALFPKLHVHLRTCFPVTRFGQERFACAVPIFRHEINPQTLPLI
jgi:hypothetical protein